MLPSTLGRDREARDPSHALPFASLSPGCSGVGPFTMNQYPGKFTCPDFREPL